MLDRDVVKDFLKEEFEDQEIKVPKDVKMKELVETFCLFVEDDYYEWLSDNYKSFFEGSDWAWIREKIRKYRNEYKDNYV